MKQIRKFIILIFLVYAGLAIFRYLIVSTTKYYTTTTQLNVRSGSGSIHPIIYTLEKGTEVEILDKGIKWYKIKHPGGIGYVNANYLKYSRTSVDKEVFTTQQKKDITLFATIGFFIFVIVPFSFKVFTTLRNNKLLKTVTALHRGTPTERELILKLLKYGFPSEAIFHDLYVKIDDSNFSQIDLVVITEVGIIVFEVKDYKGWLFGRGNDYKWTQVLAQGNIKYQFYNPVMQNNKHIENLRKQLPQFASVPFYSAIVFFGDCLFNKIELVPKDTFIIKANRIPILITTILNSNASVVYQNIREIVNILNDAVKNGEDKNIQSQHTKNIRRMLGKEY